MRKDAIINKRKRSKPLYWDIIKGVVSGYYTPKRCPVCNHLYIEEIGICNKCGFDDYSLVTQEDFDEFKKNYLENRK